MKVFENVTEWISFRRSPSFTGTLGFVPTMGALHAGHASLVKRSKSENTKTLVSIFVNPTQFNDPKDLEKYPRTIEQDLKTLEAAGADYVIYPTPVQMYPDQYKYRVQESDFSRELCGAHRPGHFDGVLTVVMKLLQLADADRAYFGEKDFQQLQLIKEMAHAFFMPVTIVPCPIVRERDGLAMSSRNVNLTPSERELAPLLFKELSSKLALEDISARLTAHGFRVDYLTETRGRRLVAAHLGSVRLIDNIPIPERNA